MKQRTSRREFARAVAVAAAGPLLPGATARGVEEPKPVMETAEALFQIVRSRFARFLTPEQMKQVAKDIVRRQYAAAVLQRVKLTNSDEPAFAFRADLP